jgi:sugar phosphate permease
VSAESISTTRRWSMLAIALAATTSANVFINGAAFLIPTLHTERGLDLAAAGLLSSMPSFGLVLTLIAWGYVVDRVGERFVLTLGSVLIAAAAIAASAVDSLVAMGAFLLLGGMAAASSNSASGRLVVGWFPPDQRGLVMGIRQTATPLGVAFGALVIPRLAESHGVSAALLFPAAVCAVSALVCAVAVIDPPRPPRDEAPVEHLANPYRGSPALWRIHAVSVLLVVPQAMVWTFTLVWLMTDRGWSAASAGALVTVAQVLGAGGRIAAGHWSDRVGRRLRPIRSIALAAAAAMGLLALSDWLGSPVSVALMVAASVITVSDNGLAFTAIAELAGPF